MARGSSHYFDASVAMFTQLGGPEVGRLARSFHSEPMTPEFARVWIEKALPVYTQSPSQLTDKPARARTVMNAELGRVFAEGELRSFDLLDGLRGIRCPTLLLAGEFDPICPVQASDDMAKVIPPEWLTYRRYPKCGHGAYRDVPEAFDEIRRFVEALGSRKKRESDHWR